MSQLFARPLRGLVRMTRRARIGDFVPVRHNRVDKGKRVRPHFDVCDGRLDLGHVARDALAPRRALLVMRVLLQRRRSRPIE